jgi:hypothetical protein
MYTLPRRLLRSSDIPLAMVEGSSASQSWVLFYFGLVFLLFLSFPVLCELADDVSYKPVNAKILSRSVQIKPIAWREDHVPKLTYSYVVDGHQHTSNRVFGGFGQNSYCSEVDAQAVINNLGTTGSCIAYVDPTNPSNSLLKRFWEQPFAFIENLMLGLLLSLCLIYLGRNSQKGTEENNIATTEQPD